MCFTKSQTGLFLIIITRSFNYLLPVLECVDWTMIANKISVKKKILLQI